MLCHSRESNAFYETFTDGPMEDADLLRRRKKKETTTR